MATKSINSKPPKAKDKKRLQKYYSKAKRLLGNEKKMEHFLRRLENKLNKIPKYGEKLAYAPIFASLLNSWFHKTYKAPMGTIIAILAALIYFVAPFDVIPDFIPGFGYIDDAGVIVACLALIKSDIEEYQEWREANTEIFVS